MTRKSKRKDLSAAYNISDNLKVCECDTKKTKLLLCCAIYLPQLKDIDIYKTYIWHLL